MRLVVFAGTTTEVAHTLDVIVTTIIAAINVASTTDLCCVPENLHVMSVEIGSLKGGLHLTRRCSRSRSARRQRPRRGHMIRWMTPLNCTPPKMDCRPHPSKREMTGRPGSSRTLQEKTRQPPCPRRLSLYGFLAFQIS